MFVKCVDNIYKQKMSFSKLNKKFSSKDVLKTYKRAFRIPIPWDLILHEDIYNWINLFQDSNNCSINLVMPSLLSMTGSLCGPNTRVASMGNIFNSSLNCYNLAICDPGGGKSITFDKVIEPTLFNYQEKTGKSLHLENYTTAGIQNHQIQNKGYGLITSDEGHRFLSNVNSKQNKGESERSLLCKMWGGKGDHATLSTGSRGFDKTSMCINLFIQPQPMLEEISHMIGSDGFLDRFLFFVSKPCLLTSSDLRNNHELLSNSTMQNFSDVFTFIHSHHENESITYTLSDEAQKEFDLTVDSFVELMNKKYSSDTGIYIFNVKLYNIIITIIQDNKISF